MSKIKNKIDYHNYYLNYCLYFEDKLILSNLDKKNIKNAIDEEFKKTIIKKCGRVTNELF
jgi:hypothetical protein